MAPFNRDPAVDALADGVRNPTKARTKTEAGRRALQAQPGHAMPLQDRLARSKALADAMGPNAPGLDMKAFTDESWGDS